MAELSQRSRLPVFTVQAGISEEVSVMSHTLANTTAGHVNWYMFTMWLIVSVTSTDSVTLQPIVDNFTHSKVLLRELKGRLIQHTPLTNF